jgi:single-strand DNA-binding protein
MINSVTITGRLTKDPQLSHTNEGKAVCNFVIACKRSNDRNEADFIRCVAWGKQAENLVKFMEKGNMIGLTGSLRSYSYNDENGKKVYATQANADFIQFLEKKKEENAI